MAKETLKYEEAMTRLENIVADMENGNLDIDSLCEKVKTAQKLIKMCRDKLTRTDEEIRKGISGNICRCTGYDLIVESIKLAAEKGGSIWA